MARGVKSANHDQKVAVSLEVCQQAWAECFRGYESWRASVERPVTDPCLARLALERGSQIGCFATALALTLTKSEYQGLTAKGKVPFRGVAPVEALELLGNAVSIFFFTGGDQPSVETLVVGKPNPRGKLQGLLYVEHDDFGLSRPHWLPVQRPLGKEWRPRPLAIAPVEGVLVAEPFVLDEHVGEAAAGVQGQPQAGDVSPARQPDQSVSDVAEVILFDEDDDLVLDGGVQPWRPSPPPLLCQRVPNQAPKPAAPLEEESWCGWAEPENSATAATVAVGYRALKVWRQEIALAVSCDFVVVEKPERQIPYCVDVDESNLMIARGPTFEAQQWVLDSTANPVAGVETVVATVVATSKDVKVKWGYGHLPPPLTIPGGRWFGGKVDLDAPVRCLCDAEPSLLQRLGLIWSHLCGSEKVAVEARESVLASVGLRAGMLVYSMLGGPHLSDRRRFVGGSIDLTQVSSIVCDNVTFELDDLRIWEAPRDAFGRECGTYQLAVLKPAVQKTTLLGCLGYPEAGRLRKVLFVNRPGYGSIAGCLPEGLSSEAQVRCEYAIIAGVLPEEVRGPFRDVRTDHLSLDEPRDVRVDQVAAGICELQSRVLEAVGVAPPAFSLH